MAAPEESMAIWCVVQVIHVRCHAFDIIGSFNGKSMVVAFFLGVPLIFVVLMMFIVVGMCKNNHLIR